MARLHNLPATAASQTTGRRTSLSPARTTAKTRLTSCRTNRVMKRRPARMSARKGLSARASAVAADRARTATRTAIEPNICSPWLTRLEAARPSRAMR